MSLTACDQPVEESPRPSTTETPTNPPVSKDSDNDFALPGYTQIEKEYQYEKYEINAEEIAGQYISAKDYGTGISSVIYTEDTIYYTLGFITDMAQDYDLGMFIIAQDIASGDTSVIHHEEQGSGYLINKMQMGDKGIYFLMNGWDLQNDCQKWRIMAYDFETKTVSTLVSSKPGVIYNGYTPFSIASSYVLWYDFPDVEGANLHIYSEESKEEIVFTEDQFSINSPYWTPDILEDTLLLVTQHKAPAKLTLYDLNENKSIRDIEIDSEIAFALLIDPNTIIWNKGYSSEGAYLSDLDKGTRYNMKLGNLQLRINKFKDNIIVKPAYYTKFYYIINPDLKTIIKSTIPEYTDEFILAPYAPFGDQLSFFDEYSSVLYVIDLD